MNGHRLRLRPNNLSHVCKLLPKNQRYPYQLSHSSSLSKPGAYITQNATPMLTVWTAGDSGGVAAHRSLMSSLLYPRWGLYTCPRTDLVVLIWWSSPFSFWQKYNIKIKDCDKCHSRLCQLSSVLYSCEMSLVVLVSVPSLWTRTCIKADRNPCLYC